MIVIVKKILAIMLCFVVVFCSVAAPQAHAIAISATTVLLSVLATGLIACGVVVASEPNLQAGLTSAWNSMTNDLQRSIQNNVLVTDVAGTLVAYWAADTWYKFSTWITESFFLDGTSTIPMMFGGLTTFVKYLEAWDYNQATLHTKVALGEVSLTNEFIKQEETVLSYYNYIVDENGFKTTINSINNSVVFESAVNTTIKSTFHNSYADGIYLYCPTLYYSTYTGYNYANYANIPLQGGVSNMRAQVLDWYITGTTNEAINGQRLLYNAEQQTIQFGNSNIIAQGTYTGIADYIYQTVISAGAVGLPLYPGQDVVGSPDDVGTTIGADVYPDYYPGTGANALPQELTGDDVIGVPLPTTKTDDGTATVDFPKIKDLVPDDVLPRVEIGDIPGDIALDTDIADSFPIDDVTTPDLPDSTTDNKNARKFKFPSIAITKFPFCIPFDIKNAFSMLAAPAAVPEFDYVFVLPSLGIRETIHISLEDFEPVAKITRWFTLALFIFLLIIATKRLIK